MKLRSRLAVTVGVLVIPLALGVATWSAWFRARTVRETLAEQLRARIEHDGEAICAHLSRPRRRGRFARGRGRGPFVYDAAFRSNDPLAPRLPAALRRALRHDDVAEVSTRGGRAALIGVRTPWVDGPCAVLVLRQPTPRLRLTWALVPALLVSFGAALVVLFAAGPIVRRIRRLIGQVQSDVRPIDVGGTDEIADLATAFEQRRRELAERMARIEAQGEALRKYLANTSHDVMTPVTVLQGHLASLEQRLNDGEPIDPTRVKAALEECNYLTALLRNLNVAAKLDAGFDQRDWAPLSLNDLVERVAARYRTMAVQRGVQLEHAVPSEPLRVHGDVTLLEQAVGNLVQNAISYNDSNGHVAVVLDPAENGFSLVILDDGPGLDASELAKITERGFRGARGRLKHPGGLGIGLGIVRDVAEVHGFSLNFERPPEGGLRVQLRGALLGPRPEA